MKDPSVSYSARIKSNFGAAADAQPNGYDLMNYSGMTQSAALYSRARGYALQDQLLDPRFPLMGQETQLCYIGSNCFNASQFRVDLSAALNGHVTPNQVRILPPQDCTAPATNVADFCGLWPRFPHHGFSNECVCSRPDSVPAPPLTPTPLPQYVGGQLCGGGQLFWTIGAPIIGVDIGLKVDSDTQRELDSVLVGTVADCADWCAETINCHAFLYHHNLNTCELRTGVDLGQKAARQNCPSTSQACLKRVEADSFDTKGLVAGMQMYFLSLFPSADPLLPSNPKSVTPQRYRTCHVLSGEARACRGSSAAVGGLPNRVFDVTVDPRTLGRGGTGRHSPSDHMYAVVRLHAETASSLLRALDVVRKVCASIH